MQYADEEISCDFEYATPLEDPAQCEESSLPPEPSQACVHRYIASHHSYIDPAFKNYVSNLFIKIGMEHVFHSIRPLLLVHVTTSMSTEWTMCLFLETEAKAATQGSSVILQSLAHSHWNI